MNDDLLLVLLERTGIEILRHKKPPSEEIIQGKPEMQRNHNTTFDPQKFELIDSIRGEFLAMKIISKGKQVATIHKTPKSPLSHETDYQITIHSQVVKHGLLLYEEIDKKTFNVENYTENLFFYTSYQKSEFVVVCQEKSSSLSYRLWKFTYNGEGKPGQRFVVSESSFKTEARINARRFKLRLSKGMYEGCVDNRGRLVDLEAE